MCSTANICLFVSTVAPHWERISRGPTGDGRADGAQCDSGSEWVCITCCCGGRCLRCPSGPAINFSYISFCLLNILKLIIIYRSYVSKLVELMVITIRVLTFVFHFLYAFCFPFALIISYLLLRHSTGLVKPQSQQRHSTAQSGAVLRKYKHHLCGPKKLSEDLLKTG